jgi:DNA-binding NarL/FixJ family response regulator
MPSPTVVIAQSDPQTAQGLAQDLHAHFSKVAVAQDATDLYTLLPRHRAQVAVLDLEIFSLEEVRELAEKYNDLAIICTHHSPDERLWMAALNAGAVEFCHPQDLHSILRATQAAAQRRLEFVA